jgi:hypothetical protein
LPSQQKYRLYMKIKLFICAALFAAACHSSKSTTADQPLPTKTLCRVWLHSREEDKDGLKNYRPADGSFQFPSARGRYGLTFAADGTGGMTYPGPTDATATAPFKWHLQQDKQSLQLEYTPPTDRPTEKYRVVQITDKLLQVKPL